jgi:hypothetical protein
MSIKFFCDHKRIMKVEYDKDCGKVKKSYMKRECWFCQKECATYISICPDCKKGRLSKKYYSKST